MNKTTAEKLNKLGYTGRNSDELLSQLPQTLWITVSDKSMKRKETFFALMLKKNRAYFTLSVQDDDNGEVFILHEEADNEPINAIIRMIFFIHRNKMMEPAL